MTNPAPEPAWHPDPWKQAELRWHDGTSWTAHTHGEVAVAAVPVPAAASPHLVSATAAAAEAPPALPAWSCTPTTSGKAISSLVTAVLGVPVVSIVLGVLARREIAAAGGRLGGAGLAKAGIVLGTLNLLLIAIIIAAVAVPTFMAKKDLPASQPAPAISDAGVPTTTDPATGLPIDPAMGEAAGYAADPAAAPATGTPTTAPAPAPPPAT